MCFELINRIDFVEDPDVSTTFHALRDPVAEAKPNAITALERLVAAGKIFVENSVVDLVLEQAKAVTKARRLKGLNTLTRIEDRSVVVCSKVEAVILRGAEVVHPDQVFASAHIRLNNKLIVLQLKDFCYLAQFSFIPKTHPTSPHRIELEVRVKLNKDFERIVRYETKRPQLV